MLLSLCLLILAPGILALPVESPPQDLQHLEALEDILEDAATASKRVLREQPQTDQDMLEKEVVGEGSEAKRITRQEPKMGGQDNADLESQTPRQPRNLDIPWSPAQGRDATGDTRVRSASENYTTVMPDGGDRRRWLCAHSQRRRSPPSADDGARHLLANKLLHGPTPTFNPQLIYNVQPPPAVNNLGVAGCGPQTLQIQETHLATQQLPQTYTASVPYIAGYRLSPIIGQKEVQLHDTYSGVGGGLIGGGQIGGGLIGGGQIGGGQIGVGYSGGLAGCNQNLGYWHNVYSHSRQSGQQLLSPDGKPVIVEDTIWPENKQVSGDVIGTWKPSQQQLFQHPAVRQAQQTGNPEDLLRPFEQARFFQPPLDLEHGLASSRDYQRHMDEMRHQMEHLESLRNNAKDSENTVPSSS